MDQQYSAIYHDQHGTEMTTITNDGHTLRMQVRTMTFTSTMLDDWELSGNDGAEQRRFFAFDHGYLTDYTLTFSTPLPTVTTHGIVLGVLQSICTKTGSHDRHNAVGMLQLCLTLEGHTYTTYQNHSWFEDALIELQSVLPKETYVRICFSCGLSDYSPYGFGFFGCLACFRDTKAGYHAVQTKSDLFALWPTMTEYVQETYWCPAFERRLPGTGYRG